MIDAVLIALIGGMIVGWFARKKFSELKKNGDVKP